MFLSLSSVLYILLPEILYCLISVLCTFTGLSAGDMKCLFGCLQTDIKLGVPKSYWIVSVRYIVIYLISLSFIFSFFVIFLYLYFRFSPYFLYYKYDTLCVFFIQERLISNLYSLYSIISMLVKRIHPDANFFIFCFISWLLFSD